MKKRSFQFPLVLGFIIVIGFLAACSKKRITQDDYAPMDAFYNKNQQQEQEFTVDTGGTGPCVITGKMGTRIVNVCDSSMFVRKSNGTAITYPYKIRLTEVYPVKDIILSKVPTMAGGDILESEAELRIRAFKDNDELALVSGRFYGIALAPSTNVLSSPEVYYGLGTSNYIDWALAGDAVSDAFPDTAGGSFNDMVVTKIDWVQCAKPHPTAASYTSITIEAVGNNTQNIDIYVVFKNFKSVMKVNNLISGQVPVGESVTVIAMALNQDNEYLLYKEDVTVAFGQRITLDFKTVSESDLLNTLSGL